MLRTLQVLLAPHLPLTSVQYYIDSDGLHGVEEKLHSWLTKSKGDTIYVQTSICTASPPLPPTCVHTWVVEKLPLHNPTVLAVCYMMVCLVSIVLCTDYRLWLYRIVTLSQKDYALSCFIWVHVWEKFLSVVQGEGGSIGVHKNISYCMYVCGISGKKSKSTALVYCTLVAKYNS